MYPFSRLFDDDFLVLEHDTRMRRHRFGDKAVAGNDRAFADDRIAAEHACTRVDRDVVLDRRVALGALELLACAQRERTERDALI